MGWRLFDYVTAQGRNDFRYWSESLQKVERIKLAKKLDMLQQHGTDLFPLLLAGPITDHIYKLKIKGDRQLRPRLCKGPIHNETEFTLLVGALEIGGKDDPPDVDAQAEDRRAAVAGDATRRRCTHERVK